MVEDRGRRMEDEGWRMEEWRIKKAVRDGWLVLGVNEDDGEFGSRSE